MAPEVEAAIVALIRASYAKYVPRIGRVLIARGRDAADVAMTTTFGPNELEGFKVWTDEVSDTEAALN